MDIAIRALSVELDEKAETFLALFSVPLLRARDSDFVRAYEFELWISHVVIVKVIAVERDSKVKTIIICILND